MKNRLIKVHPKDNVAIVLVNLWKDNYMFFNQDTIHIKQDTPAKHKIALVSLKAGDSVVMYGILVGAATKNIKKGEILKVDNVVHKSNSVINKTKQTPWSPPDISKWKARTFMGYYRSDGQVGTKNTWLFFPLVFCENRNIELLKEVFESELSFRKGAKQKQLLRNLISGNAIEFSEETLENEVFKNIEIKFITHQGGCGGIRQDSDSLSKLLAGYVNNPNVAGATILSLGCQNLQIDIFKNALEKINPNIEKPLLIYEQQQIGTIDTMLETIIKDSFKEIKKANQIERRPAPLSKIKLGLECGGSDGFSGISANPALGYTSDLLAALNGSPILAEFPELCGVEEELVNRCIDNEAANKFMELMKAYEKAAINSGSGFNMNPSPGNIKDGLITDAMKSAGAAKKGGTSPICDVLDYGEYVIKPGLNLLCTPGNDVESTTALAGAGANVIVFTTGLGTPTGNPITPVIKVSSNSILASNMPDIIDFDAGSIIKGEKSIQEVGENLLEYIIEVASGSIKTKADRLNQNDFIPWKRGVSL